MGSVCIDKSSSAELTEAINSMFAWYRDAARCYVYLPDISIDSLSSDPSAQHDWYTSFQQSRWFTRGWTLQELVAPASVEFFSVEGQRLGNKYSLLQELHDITGIRVEALQGSPLDEFSVDERMSWIGQRRTKRQEDVAYSLLGIFNVHMPLIYGEGREKAFARLRREINGSSDTNQASVVPQQEPWQHQGSATLAYHGPVFYAPISGHHVVMPGTQVTGGTVNFDFGEGRDVRRR
jgi:hypothetical protein